MSEDRKAEIKNEIRERLLDYIPSAQVDRVIELVSELETIKSESKEKEYKGIHIPRSVRKAANDTLKDLDPVMLRYPEQREGESDEKYDTRMKYTQMLRWYMIQMYFGGVIDTKFGPFK